MDGLDCAVTESRIRQLVGDSPLGLSGYLPDAMARHVCLMFYQARRATAQVNGASAGGEPAGPRVGVSTGQPHRPGDYRYVADFLDAITEGSISENGNPAHRRSRTIRDQLGIPELLVGSIAAGCDTSDEEIANVVASSPALYQWWCEVVDECEALVGAMPMTELLFRHSAYAKQAMRNLANVTQRPKSEPTQERSHLRVAAKTNCGEDTSPLTGVSLQR